MRIRWRFIQIQYLYLMGFQHLKYFPLKRRIFIKKLNQFFGLNVLREKFRTEYFVRN